MVRLPWYLGGNDERLYTVTQITKVGPIRLIYVGHPLFTIYGIVTISIEYAFSNRIHFTGGRNRLVHT